MIDKNNYRNHPGFSGGSNPVLKSSGQLLKTTVLKGMKKDAVVLSGKAKRSAGAEGLPSQKRSRKSSSTPNTVSENLSRSSSPTLKASPPKSGGASANNEAENISLGEIEAQEREKLALAFPDFLDPEKNQKTYIEAKNTYNTKAESALITRVVDAFLQHNHENPVAQSSFLRRQLRQMARNLLFKKHPSNKSRLGPPPKINLIAPKSPPKIGFLAPLQVLEEGLLSPTYKPLPDQVTSISPPTASEFTFKDLAAGKNPFVQTPTLSIEIPDNQAIDDWFKTTSPKVDAPQFSPSIYPSSPIFPYSIDHYFPFDLFQTPVQSTAVTPTMGFADLRLESVPKFDLNSGSGVSTQVNALSPQGDVFPSMTGFEVADTSFLQPSSFTSGSRPRAHTGPAVYNAEAELLSPLGSNGYTAGNFIPSQPVLDTLQVPPMRNRAASNPALPKFDFWQQGQVSLLPEASLNNSGSGAQPSVFYGGQGLSFPSLDTMPPATSSIQPPGLDLSLSSWDRNFQTDSNFLNPGIASNPNIKTVRSAPTTPRMQSKKTIPYTPTEQDILKEAVAKQTRAKGFLSGYPQSR
jgi:hypothetical protein